jgi:hypothetical protein
MNFVCQLLRNVIFILKSLSENKSAFRYNYSDALNNVLYSKPDKENCTSKTLNALLLQRCSKNYMAGCVRIRRCIRTESITKYTLTSINTRSEATQRVMAAKLTRLTHKIAIQLNLEAESCTIYTSHSRRPVGKLLDTPSYFVSLFEMSVFCLYTRLDFNATL